MVNLLKLLEVMKHLINPFLVGKRIIVELDPNIALQVIWGEFSRGISQFLGEYEILKIFDQNMTPL